MISGVVVAFNVSEPHRRPGGEPARRLVIQAVHVPAPTMGIADGVDEVHKATVARRVLRGYHPHEGYWPTEYIPAKREQAWQRMRPVLDARPDLARAAEKYAGRH